MTGLPFLDVKKVPINCIPICPSLHQVLSIENICHSIQKRGGQLNAIKAEALLCSLDKPVSGVLDISNIYLSPEKELLRGKMYFVVEFLKLLENCKLGYCIISIITGRPDIEEALVKVLTQYISSHIVRIETISLKGHGDGFFTGGVTVHIKSDEYQHIGHTALSDLVLVYDADLVGSNFTRVFNLLPFDCNPAMLHLSTFGSPESRFREYFKDYTEMSLINPQTLDLDCFFKNCMPAVAPLLMGKNDVFTYEEFKLWNDSIAQHVVNWFIYGDNNEYKFEGLFFPTDVPSKFLHPPQ